MFYPYFVEGNWKRREEKICMLWQHLTVFLSAHKSAPGYCETLMQVLGLTVLHMLGSGYRKWERNHRTALLKSNRNSKNRWADGQTAEMDQQLSACAPKKFGVAFMTIFQLQDMNHKVSWHRSKDTKLSTISVGDMNIHTHSKSIILCHKNIWTKINCSKICTKKEFQ